MQSLLAHGLFTRQDNGNSQTDELLDLLSDGFGGQLSDNAFYSSLATSLGLTAVMALAFCFLRPYNSVVYAPRAKHADSKHAPPTLSKGVFDWIPPVAKTKEQDFVDRVGLDAAVFMRVARMLRNIFLVLSVIGCGVLIPTYLVSPVVPTSRKRQDDGAPSANFGPNTSFFLKITPQNMFASPGLWAMVACVYAFDGVICYFLWRNYGAITRLRRAYFDSPEYQRSLHSRTLLLTDIPKELRTDDGIIKITDDVRGTDSVPRAAIARNVKDLPDLVEEHEETVRKLEGYLAKYLKNPDKLPETRPTCKPSKNDKSYNKGQKVDAIEYMTSRIKELEHQIKEVRESVDKRNALPFGFASYERISEAHSVAYVARKKAPHGSQIRLAPRPHDLVWRNLKLLRKDRKWKNFINNLWIALLTFFWVGPNVFIAIFLANLSNLAALWPAFATSLKNHEAWWGIVQGVAAPAITTLFFYFLPRIFRRLCINAGDVTKSSRERHVTHKLYTFFVFNNLILFSLFATIFGFVVKVIRASEETGSDVWDTIRGIKYAEGILRTLTGISPYWISWLLQRNLGAAIDLSQLVNLAWRSFSRKFLAPTPRELIELSAPQPFDYAAYYNYFLFYATVALCFATIQPLVLPVAAFYFWLDSYLKKYLLLYVFVTKYESGGMFWRTIYNRIVFAMLLSTAVVALIVVVFGGLGINWGMLASLAPLPVAIAGFKWYCARTFDDQIHWFQKGKALKDVENAGEDRKSRKNAHVGTRFGHPVLYQPLITPMVSKKAQHLLKQVYGGRTSLDENRYANGYSDVYMDEMDNHKPGKPAGGDAVPGFEFVDESNMDFENYKNRPEFRDQAGGDGQLYGNAADILRPGTPGSMMTGITRSDTWQTNDNRRSRSESRNRHNREDSGDSDFTRVNDDGMTEYPRGYHQTPKIGRDLSPSGSERSADRAGLVTGAARFARSPSPPRLPDIQAPTPGGYGPIHMSSSAMNTPGSQGEEDTSYDYFRRGRGM